MQRTENFNLGLWEGTDYPNYTMPNENMNTIDTELKNMSNNIETAKQIASSELNAVEAELQIADTELDNKISENSKSIELLDDNVQYLRYLRSRVRRVDNKTFSGARQTIKIRPSSNFLIHKLWEGHMAEDSDIEVRVSTVMFNARFTLNNLYTNEDIDSLDFVTANCYMTKQADSTYVNDNAYGMVTAVPVRSIVTRDGDNAIVNVYFMGYVVNPKSRYVEEGNYLDWYAEPIATEYTCAIDYIINYKESSTPEPPTT